MARPRPERKRCAPRVSWSTACSADSSRACQGVLTCAAVEENASQRGHREVSFHQLRTSRCMRLCRGSTMSGLSAPQQRMRLLDHSSAATGTPGAHRISARLCLRTAISRNICCRDRTVWGSSPGGTSMEKIMLLCLIVGTIGVLAELLPVLPSQK